MARLSEQELRRLIQGGETSIVELKAAAPRPVEMAALRVSVMAPHVGRQGGNEGGPLPRADLLTGFQATWRLWTSRMGCAVISLTAKHRRRLSGNCRGAA